MRRSRRVGRRAVIEQSYAAKGAVRLLDMGGGIRYLIIFGADYLEAHRVSITSICQRRACRIILTGHCSPRLSADCCDLSFEDGAFDIAHLIRSSSIWAGGI
jgi:hypothetical protein